MKKISIQEVRNALIACDFLSKEDSVDMSDDLLAEKNFQKDLNMDSLDFMLLIEKLEDGYALSMIDIHAWDCRTVGQLIELSEK